MRKALLFPIFLLLSVSFTYAQNKLEGTVLDQKNKPIYFSTIAVFSETDSQYIASSTSDEQGNFVIANLDKGPYYLQCNLLGYKSVTVKNITLPAEKLNITLQKTETALKEVDIVAKRSFIEQQSDRMVVNVEDKIAGNNSTLLDVMKQVPGMLVVNDRLSLAGQSNVTILINGKSTKYMDVDALLKDMPGDNIKKVEIIHQPGAEFEASGTGPIINIILKKNSLFGTNGSAHVTVGKGYNYFYNTGVSLSHYKNKLNFNTNIGYNKNAWLEEMEVTRNIAGDKYIQSNFDPSRPQSFRIGASLNYDITDKHSVGIGGRFNYGNGKKIAENTTIVDFLDTNSVDLNLLSHNTRDRDWNRISFNPYYTFTIDTLGQKLELAANFFRQKRNGENELSTEELNFDGFIPGQRYNQEGLTQIYSAQIDYTKPFNKNISLKAGSKYSDASLDNDLRSFYEDSMNVWLDNPFQSNRYLFDESISAVYSKLTFKKDKWSGTLGLRYEHSKSVGYSATIDSTISNTISKLFPSASLGWKFSEKIGVNAAYSYRIDRPRYSSLNPFVYYWDPYTYESGNPVLVPVLTHSTQLNFTFENQPFLQFEYKRSKNAIVDVTEQDDETGEAFLTTVNLDNLDLFSSSLFFPLDPIPGINGYGGIITYYKRYDSQYLDELFQRDKWVAVGFLQVNFTLPGDIDTEVSGWITSGELEGTMEAEWMFGTNAGVSKKFLDNRLKVNLSVSDFVNRFWHADINHATTNANLVVKWDAPEVNMRISYRFGNQHITKKKKGKNSAEQEIDRTQE